MAVSLDISPTPTHGGKLVHRKKSHQTFFTEVNAIDLSLQLVNLLELLHDNNVVHTNLCPEAIFLRDKNLEQMQFLNLYHCTKDIKGAVGFKYVTL